MALHPSLAALDDYRQLLHRQLADGQITIEQANEAISAHAAYDDTGGRWRIDANGAFYRELNGAWYPADPGEFLATAPAWAGEPAIPSTQTNRLLPVLIGGVVAAIVAVVLVLVVHKSPTPSVVPNARGHATTTLPRHKAPHTTTTTAPAPTTTAPAPTTTAPPPTTAPSSPPVTTTPPTSTTSPSAGQGSTPPPTYSTTPAQGGSLPGTTLPPPGSTLGGSRSGSGGPAGTGGAGGNTVSVGP